MALRGDERIIDFGSGLGQFTRAMARAVPLGRVVGIERNEEQLAGTNRLAAAEDEAELVEFRRGDVLNLELAREESGSFDVAHARFILEHVPDPLRVVKTMVRAVKQGGRIVLADDDHDVLRLWPECGHDSEAQHMDLLRRLRRHGHLRRANREHGRCRAQWTGGDHWHVAL